MKKIILLFSAIFVFTSVIHAHADPWRLIKDNAWSPTFGRPLKTLKIVTTKEIERQDAVYYSFKLVIQRPGRDDGTGVAAFDWLNYRLYYWAATSGTDPYLTLYNDINVFQIAHPYDNRKVVVHLLQGLRPGKYIINVAVIPYPMIAGYSTRGIIHFIRNPYTLLFGDPYANFFADLQTVVTTASPQAAIGKIVYDHAKDATVNGIIKRIVNYYGQKIELTVLAKMPEIWGKDIRTANLMLTRRNLVPQPDEYNVIYTDNPNLDRKVAKHKFNYNDRLYAGTAVPYKIYRYMPPQQNYGQEICGDGIDNNGNNEIDEGCNFSREVLVDDNECPDDSIVLIIDGINYGQNPAGHKRHFNLSNLSWGRHSLEVYGLKSGGNRYKDSSGQRCANNKVITYSIKLGDGIFFSSGGQKKSKHLTEGKTDKYTVIVK